MWWEIFFLHSGIWGWILESKQDQWWNSYRPRVVWNGVSHCVWNGEKLEFPCSLMNFFSHDLWLPPPVDHSVKLTPIVTPSQLFGLLCGMEQCQADANCHAQPIIWSTMWHGAIRKGSFLQGPPKKQISTLFVTPHLHAVQARTSSCVLFWSASRWSWHRPKSVVFFFVPYPTFGCHLR
jgi:hypothetical protein